MSDYSHPSLRRGSLDGFDYVIVEVNAGGGRLHRRILASSLAEPSLMGRPLFYSDTYKAERGEPTYTYARHGASVSTFFRGLNFLLEEHDLLRESERSQYRAIFNIRGELLERDINLPFLDESIVRDDGQLQFCRLFLPFGDISVEFCAPVGSATDQLTYLASYGRLTSVLERPLLACDLSRAPAYAQFMARLHWASDRVPVVTLQRLCDEFSCVYEVA
jgi:hypothetical protein